MARCLVLGGLPGGPLVRFRLLGCLSANCSAFDFFLPPSDRGVAALLPQAARDRAQALASRARDAMNPFGLLGFDPLELWAQLKHFYRP